LLLMKIHFQQGTYSIYFTFAMPNGKITPKHLTSMWKLVTNCKTMISCQKVPSFNTLELTWTTIIINNMLLQLAPFKFEKLPMQCKGMLNKQSIMFFLIWYIIMNVFKDFTIVHSWVIVGVMPICNVNQHCDL
jgi:hypothetical protein